MIAGLSCCIYSSVGSNRTWNTFHNRWKHRFSLGDRSGAKCAANLCGHANASDIHRRVPTVSLSPPPKPSMLRHSPGAGSDWRVRVPCAIVGDSAVLLRRPIRGNRGAKLKFCGRLRAGRGGARKGGSRKAVRQTQSKRANMRSCPHSPTHVPRPTHHAQPALAPPHYRTGK